MRRFALNRHALTIVAAAALLAGCAVMQPAVDPLEARNSSPSILTSREFASLYSFQGGQDGATPYAPLLYFRKAIYGTTYDGGANNAGTVFRLTLSGKEHILHTFGSYGDGANPYSALIAVSGTLYGTTEYGGTSGDGTVFKITPSGAESVIHSFGGGSGDGAAPSASLVALDGMLYGTTARGGSYNQGTVFEISPSGADSVLYSFGAGYEDASTPDAGLVVVRGILYGATNYGGIDGGSCPSYGCGAVFAIKPSGQEKVLFRFEGNDGENPWGPLVDRGGVLYGTTVWGGSFSDGTVFRVTTSGTQKVLYSFQGGRDGINADAALTNVGGALFGTTNNGGRYSDGTIFTITTTGEERVLHAFSGSEGTHPIASLINVRGFLYGTASAGGSRGSGSVFRLVL
jgi:uncharacterized repeat protein (TIGR03803 family)